MDKRFYFEIENSFTPSRLFVYKQDGADDLTCLVRYLFIIEVCKSFHSSLNVLEVTFRIAIDKALCSVAGADNWYNILTLDIHDIATTLFFMLKEHQKVKISWCSLRHSSNNLFRQ